MHTVNPVIVAVDIGGTKTAAAAVSDAGEVLTRTQTATPARDGGPAILAAALDAAAQVAEGYTVSAVGVGAAGVIGPDGVVASATDLLTGWAGTDIAGVFRRRFGVHTVVVNDAHAHAAGEALAGAGRGHGTVLVVAVGTGIGGGVVIGGRPQSGAHGAAGHLGHVPSPEAAGLVCSCGRTGHLEPLASGTGILALYRRLGGAMADDGREVAARADVDAVARRTLVTAGRALGTGIGGLVNVIDPDIVVIAGSVAGAGDVWWDAVRTGVSHSVLPALDGVPVRPARLGDDAALIGAALLAARTSGEPAGGRTATAVDEAADIEQKAQHP